MRLEADEGRLRPASDLAVLGGVASVPTGQDAAVLAVVLDRLVIGVRFLVRS